MSLAMMFERCVSAVLVVMQARPDLSYSIFPSARSCRIFTLTPCQATGATLGGSRGRHRLASPVQGSVREEFPMLQQSATASTSVRTASALGASAGGPLRPRHRRGEARASSPARYCMCQVSVTRVPGREVRQRVEDAHDSRPSASVRRFPSGPRCPRLLLPGQLQPQ